MRVCACGVLFGPVFLSDFGGLCGDDAHEDESRRMTSVVVNGWLVCNVS